MSFNRIMSKNMPRVSLKKLILSLIIILLLVYWLPLYSPFYFHQTKTDFIPLLTNAVDMSRKCLPLVGTRSKRIDDTYVLNSDLCRGDKTKLLILVFSAPQNFISREAIRKTWGSIKIDSISIGFLLGKVKSLSLQEDIKKEFDMNCDIIQDDSFLDDYYNLTAKAISMLKWTNFYCKGAQGVFRGADDIWLNQDKAFDLLTYYYEREGIYGVIFRRTKPIRNPHYKWFMPMSRYNQTYYPDYIQGHSYLVIRGKERNIFELMVNASKSIYLVQMEDVDITGFIADALKIERFYANGFNDGKVLPLNESINIYKNLITSHYINDEEKYFLWKKMKSKPNKLHNGIDSESRGKEEQKTIEEHNA